jgi:predicted membrane protein
MKSKHWFWGLFFLLAAVFVLASQIGAFGEIGALSILATFLAGALCIHSAVRRNFFGAFFSLALIYLIYQKPLHLYQFSFWLLFLVVILASIGCGILFGGHRWYNNCNWHGNSHKHIGPSSENIDDNSPSAEVSFQSASKYLHSDALKEGWFSSSFGKLEVFFDQARLAPEGAEIHVECSFGSLELYLPRGWDVTDHVETSFGSVESDIRSNRPDADAPRLTVTGEVAFGSLMIHYI